MPFVDLTGLPEREPIPGYRARFVHTENLTLAYWDIEAGAPLPEHVHPHEQIASVIVGCLEFSVAGETRVLEAGSVAVVPPNAVHSGRALTACRMIAAFSPVRQDYL